MGNYALLQYFWRVYCPVCQLVYILIILTDAGDTGEQKFL